MIRWKILKQSIKLLLATAFLWSCSEKKSNFGQDIFLEISERKEFKIGWDGLYNSFLTPYTLAPSDDKGLIYNYLNHSLDSIFFSKDSAWSKTGEMMEYEGPFGVERISSFFVWNDTIVLFTNSVLFFKSIQTGEVRKKILLKYPFFKDQKFDQISLSGNIENRFLSYDQKREKAYFMISNFTEKKFYPVSLDLKAGFFEKLPVYLDTIRLKELTLTLNIGQGSISTPDDPAIRLIGDRLFFTYPTFNELVRYEVEEKSQQKFSHESASFPSQRNFPQISSEKMEIMQALELSKNWQNQVSFGPLGYSLNNDLYFRFVQGGVAEASEKSGQIFLELFSKEFQKIQEVSISQLNPDLSRQYIQTKYGLMVKALDQPKEDVMYFYYLNINRSK